MRVVTAAGLAFCLVLCGCGATELAERDYTNYICRDDNEDCQYWADKHYCTSGTYSAFMADHCPLACNLCTATYDATYDWSDDDNIYIKSDKGVLLTGCSTANKNKWVVKTISTSPGYHLKVICGEYELEKPFELKADYDGKSYTNDEWSAVIRETTEGNEIKLGLKFQGSEPNLACSVSSQRSHAKHDSGFSCHCGKKNSATERIVGGTMAGTNEIPWQVGTIWNRGGGDIGRDVHCGGTILSSRWVVSANHCMDEKNLLRWAIMYGTNERLVQPDNLIDVEEVIGHRNFNTPTSWNNDIVLMKLKRAIEFSRTVSPACLPKLHKSYTGMDALISGWGLTSTDGSPPTALKKVTMRMMRQSSCRRYWGQTFQTKTQLCCEIDPGSDSCQGDSGGPLAIKDGNNYDLVGIVSYGQKCADPNFPGVYTNVAAYLGWMQRHRANTPDDQTCPR